MIGLDTNVLVRALVRDDEQQSRAAAELLGRLTPERPGWISQIVLVELYWVLRRSYRVPVNEVLGALAALLDSSDLIVEHRETVVAALEDATAGADLADALVAHGARRAGAGSTVTLDRRAVTKVSTMRLLDE